jgi:hypothetical protein
MAIAVIGGVISSTFLTLLVVPVVFAALERILPTRRTPRLMKAEQTEGDGELSVKEVA